MLLRRRIGGRPHDQAHLMRHLRRITAFALLASLLLPFALHGQAKVEPKKLPTLKVNPPAERPSLIEKMNKLDPNAQTREEKLRSPRELFKTFFFAVALYDSFPGMIED